MDIRVAVASSDGQTINEHFGKAASFLIYQLNEGAFEFLETRQVTPACAGGEHAGGAIARNAQVIADCRGVVVAQVGPGAIDTLISHRIQAFTMEGGIEAALETLSRSKRFKQRK